MTTTRNLFFGLLLAIAPSASFADPIEVLTSLEPYRSIEINPIETGVISKIIVKEGQMVKANDPLIELDNETILARLATAQLHANNEGNVIAAQAEYDLQEAKLARLKRLSGPSRAEVAREEATLKIREGNLITSKAEKRGYELQVEQIQLEIDRRVLKTPIDGTVTEITKDISESVTINQVRDDNFLVQIVQLDRLKAEANIPANAVVNLTEGQTLGLRIEDAEGTMVTGTIEFISPVIDPATSTGKVRLVIDNSEGKLRSGSSGYVLVE